MFGIIFGIWNIYTLILLINFLVIVLKVKEQPWTKIIAQISEPAVNIGKIVTKKLFGDQEFKFDMPALMAVLVSIVASAVVGFVVDLIF